MSAREWQGCKQSELGPVVRATATLDFAVTHPLRPVALAGVLSLLLFAMSSAFVYVNFFPLMPRTQVLPLTGYVIVLVIAWAVLDFTMIVRRPTAEESVRIWGPAATAIVLASHVACIWLIWQVLPYGSFELQLAAVIFMTAYVPTQIICSPENTLAIRLGIVTVLGSMVAFLATRDQSLGVPLALYMTGFGVVMFFLSKVVHQTVQSTVSARLESEAATRSLESLLASVAAERDAKTRFIATASHDLGQPLQAASLFFDQLLRAQTEGQRVSAAEGVRKAFVSAEQLLAHMLSHLRLEADAVEPHLSRVALGPIFARIAGQFAPAAKQAGLRIRVVDTRLMLWADPALLDRALGNLLANAVQHSGGTKVLVGARRDGPSGIRIWVIDNGVGIGRADASNVFDEYYQGSDSRAPVKSGFGLGLSSVRRIAQLMDGVAGLDLHWIQGAAFYMSFPSAGLPRRPRHGIADVNERGTRNEVLPHL